MSPELDKKLCEKYPLIFANRHAPMTQTAMCWGFECGDGWYNILDCLCSGIQWHIDAEEKNYQWTIGFNKKIEEARKDNVVVLDSLTYPAKERLQLKEPVTQVVATQVKEKYGGLRFYYTGGDDYIMGLVAMAEMLSQVTCEQCGDRGQLYTSGWHRTLCETHAKEWGHL